ncbi:mannosyl-oligosaccharide glucosidase-like [Saccostrea cucullata]|uniref:mannosyl-oligosaccharide glucosidase-like n=1 Tax=Saccostrea cuccullata TaxID=36930 RepID=UPI002ED65D78
MWMKQFPDSRKQGSNKLRHWCKEDDELVKYGWLRHDGSSFGIHEVEEEEFIFNTTFVKRQVGHHGWEWSARITAFSTNQNNAPVVSFFTYAALDKQGNLSYFKNNGKSAIVGSSEELGDFHISFKTSTDSRIIVHDSFEGHVSGLDVLDKTLSEHFVPKPLVENKEYMSLNGTKETDRGINFVVHQITAQLPLKFDIILKSNSVRSENILQGEILTREIEKRSGEFDKKFSSVFNLESKKYTLKAINFAKAALSNMLGSISYFHGSSRVQSEKSEEVLKHRQATLYTSIPSRSKFPRGFLWNVGFDLHLITLWDAKISKDIIAHWLNLINEEGWIPREQILGEEAEAKVPSEFIVQRNNIANPPSLFLAIQHLIKNKQNVKVFLEIFFPKMEKWFEWLQVSQAGKIHTSFYWRGRKGFAEMEFIPYTYASGLDDYPRASHPDENERHLDLRCWMAMASGVLANIAKRIGEDSSAYEKIYEDLTDNELLDRLHWDSKQKIFSDYGLHANDIDIYSDDGVLIDNIDMFSPTSKFYYVHAHPTFRYTGIFGYVSLYPLMLKILDSDSPRLEKMLSDLRKEDLLWTKYGIRSLSIKSEFYNKPNTFTDPPHWRGAIWINMNYLIISGLHHYSQVPGPYQNQASNIYTELRKNVVQNIFKQYNKRGYVFEQYDDITGIGKGSYPFTGWSALVVNIMAEKY